MVAIAPFRALRFDPGRVDLAAATSPPHDCITPAQAAQRLEGDPHSIVQVVLPPERPGDGEADKHQRAAAALRKWAADGAMGRDARPALYHYEVQHGPPEARRTMRGLFARVALDPDYRHVRRHEMTLQRRKKDRLRLREATGCDTEAIWLLYRDTRGWVDEVLASNAFEELARFTDEEGCVHRLWRVDRPEAVGEVVAQFEDRTLVIADGHHRYQTALDHFAATGDPRHGSILACLVRDTDPGVSILATHRLVHGLPLGSLKQAVDAARLHWEAEPVPLGDEAALRAEAILAAVDPSRTDVVVAGLEDGRLAAWRMRLRASSRLALGRGRLDALAVTAAHERLLRDCWGIDLGHPEEHLRFTRDGRAALGHLLDGSSQFAVLLPPEPVAAVLEVAQQGHLMPQKSTYFVPKVRSGLVLGPLDEAPPKPWAEATGDGGEDGGKPDWRMPPLG